MKKALIIALGLACVIGSATTVAGTRDPGVNARQQHQNHRIKQGVKSGSLTGKEAYRLEREQVRLRRQERRFKSDGVMTKRERLVMHRDLNRSSKHIYHQKHDGQRRNRQK